MSDKSSSSLSLSEPSSSTSAGTAVWAMQHHAHTPTTHTKVEGEQMAMWRLDYSTYRSIVNGTVHSHGLSYHGGRVASICREQHCVALLGNVAKRVNISAKHRAGGVSQHQQQQTKKRTRHHVCCKSATTYCSASRSETAEVPPLVLMDFDTARIPAAVRMTVSLTHAAQTNNAHNTPRTCCTGLGDNACGLTLGLQQDGFLGTSSCVDRSLSVALGLQNFGALAALGLSLQVHCRLH